MDPSQTLHDNTESEWAPHRYTTPLWEVERELCIAAVAHVLGSKTFNKAARLCALLEYICKQELAGRGSNISEVTVGVAVFGRSEQYNTSDDNIVRSTVRLLRQKLDTYYMMEGIDEPIQISVPKGSYVPTFEKRAPDTVNIVPLKPQMTVSVERDDASTRTRSLEPGRTKPLWKAFVAGVLVAFSIAICSYLWVSPGILQKSRTERFWSLLFNEKQPTLLVPADTALMLYERAVHRTVSLDQYVGGAFAAERNSLSPEALALLDGLKNRRYTAVTSVALAAELGGVKKNTRGQLQVRFSRDLRLTDLKQSNVILVGAEQTNPWLHLFRPHLNFHLDWDSSEDRFRILNDNPMSGEPTEWPWSRDDVSHRGFGQIALLPNWTRRQAGTS